MFKSILQKTLGQHVTEVRPCMHYSFLLIYLSYSHDAPMKLLNSHCLVYQNFLLYSPLLFLLLCLHLQIFPHSLHPLLDP